MRKIALRDGRAVREWLFRISCCRQQAWRITGLERERRLERLAAFGRARMLYLHIQYF